MTTYSVEQSTPVAKSDLPFPVVGIGASAGGIAALTAFFERIDEPIGMAFAVILHLSPKHESNVAAILQRVTPLTVVQVNERMPLLPDHVYVIPPGRDLNMDDGHVSVKEPTREGGPHVAVDLFLRTLAEAHGDRAFAVVLSGLGSDGALGVRRINECGGVAIAQLPAEAEFDSMPRAAIGTGLVDLVLPVAEMPGRLRSMWSNIREMRLPAEADLQHPVRAVDDGDERLAAEAALGRTLALLHKRTRHDFRHYKRATVLRRLERRLQVNAVPDLTAYHAYLDRHPAETGALLQDMLISVTSFFRDPQAFAALQETVIPSLFEGRDASDTVRVWVAACATGEEAYSIAILLREHLETLAQPPRVQVFATDIDERAIAIGRTGLYSEGIANDVSPSRLRRFFHQEDDRYRVVKPIRESVLFAVHNMLRDPPFSRLDLVSCRNFLIYLDGDAQKAVFETARFALTSRGHLFLGSSESADGASDLFLPRDAKHRIFDAAGEASPSRTASTAALMARGTPASVLVATDRIRSSSADRHRLALERYGPASVLVDVRQQILHLSHAAGPYFIRTGGIPSHDLVANIRPELRADMRTAAFRAQQTNESVAIRALWTEEDGHRRHVLIEIHPFHDDEANATSSWSCFANSTPG